MKKTKAKVDISDLVRDAHKLATKKGWWNTRKLYTTEPTPNVPEKLALIHSEVSEALEAFRDSESGLDLRSITYSSSGDSELAKPEGFAVELADAVIRIADLCGHLRIDLAEAIKEKHEYNKTRPFRHGGKKA